MQTSVYLAKLMGPVIAVAGIGFLLNREAFMDMARDFLESTGMIMMSGFLALVMGLAIVNAHNIWVADFFGKRLINLCGASGSCPLGLEPGDPISPAGEGGAKKPRLSYRAGPSDTRARAARGRTRD